MCLPYQRRIMILMHVCCCCALEYERNNQHMEFICAVKLHASPQKRRTKHEKKMKI